MVFSASSSPLKLARCNPAGFAYGSIQLMKRLQHLTDMIGYCSLLCCQWSNLVIQQLVHLIKGTVLSSWHRDWVEKLSLLVFWSPRKSLGFAMTPWCIRNPSRSLPVEASNSAAKWYGDDQQASDTWWSTPFEHWRYLGLYIMRTSWNCLHLYLVSRSHPTAFLCNTGTNGKGGLVSYSED